MDWQGLHFLTGSPPAGETLMSCHHNPFLVTLAFLVAALASFATLDMAERVSLAEHESTRRMWRWVGALCLAGGVWAMHFISMLAFQAPVPVRYDLSLTIASLMIAIMSALLAMYTLSHARLHWGEYAWGALWVGVGLSTMHYVGMAAMRSQAVQYYQPWLFALSVLLAIATSLLLLLLGRHFRHGIGLRYLLLKYGASLVIAAGISSLHLVGMLAMSMAVPSGTAMQMQGAENSLHLALAVAVITILIIGSGLSAALADKKLEGKERDLRRVNALLSQLDQARMSLQHAAHYDVLTSLVNRRGFNQLFAERLAEQRAANGMLAVMFLDIDHFKRINDSLGHDAGDELLKVIAGHIRSATRSQDVVARFGGDEFCILISLSNLEEVRLLGHRVMHKMKTPIALAGRQMVMTTSIGVSVFPEDGDSCEELLKHADLALYESKGNGRNSLNFFNKQLRNRATLELQLEEELRGAIHASGSQLQLYYQPIIDLASAKVTKLEALVRWQHPQQGLLTPERFIAIAEANGLIAELDNWVLRRACRDLAQLKADGFTQLKISVNCSALNLSREELPGEILQALASTGVSAGQLELEVTENALMNNISGAIVLLREIRSQGVSLSIDDFGTGYSSLAYLKRLPLDALKIDRSFIQDIPGSRQDRDIVEAIVVMAHTLQLKVVAEGVETEAQLDCLKAFGCDFVQGYLFSRPAPLPELLDLIARLERADAATLRAGSL